MRCDGKPVRLGMKTTRRMFQGITAPISRMGLIRAYHQGQQSCAPHQQAEHKTAPDHHAAASVNPCNAGAIPARDIQSRY